MKNIMMKKRMASIAAAALMSVTSVAGTIGSTTVPFAGNLLTSYAAESSVKITASAGYEEGMYATWSPVANATGYNVYVDGTQIDSMLIRQYSGYFRADAVGLKSGSHTMKVVPLISGKEDSSKAGDTTVSSTNYDRSGFAFSADAPNPNEGVGAYNNDGTLKSNALVIYVTEATKNTVKANIGGTELTGIANITQQGKKCGVPLCFRIIGQVTLNGLSSSDMSSAYALGVKEAKNVTFEGIGNDATLYGAGLAAFKCSSIEMRNIGLMLWGGGKDGDGVTLKETTKAWIHNIDFFYGEAGGDSDQAKGDGSMDLKDNSQYVTISYNHFYDSGKMSLCGMKSESGENWISYHHNWFDHSDSRHPRIRTMTVHVYNNYFDGNAKYGVGVTYGGNAFVEANYFRNCPKPMMISMQGTDAKGEGTFSGENGGMIKSYGNYMDGSVSYITQKDTSNKQDIDAYEASSRDEKVPSDYTAKAGGTSYNNFDTSSKMYSYTADKAEDVPAIVTSKAGRLDGGDFKWQFDNSVDDASYSKNSALYSALEGYKTGVIAIGSGFKSDTGSSTPASTTAASTTKATTTAATTVKTTSAGSSTPVTGGYVHNFTKDGASSSFYTISGNLSTSKGTVSYNGLTLTQCLKMESATTISFNAPSDGKLTLVFAEDAATAKLNGTKLTASGGVITADVKAGTNTITKADTANLFYMVYSGSGSSVVTTAGTTAVTSSQSTTKATTSPTPTDTGDVKVVSAGGWNEMMYLVLSGVKDSDVTAVDFNGPTSGSLTGEDFEYLVRDTDKGLRVDILGVSAGTYSITLTTSKGKFTKPNIEVTSQDRSGYAHYKYDKGVGAYTDNGVIKANAKILYVTEENKNTVSVTSKDGTKVTGIGNILNSAGMESSGGKTSNGGKANSNQGIIKKLAEDGTPLVVRIIGNVSAPDGVTVFDSVDMGGSVGDNGGMARMKSGKDVTIEGVGSDAVVNGWGFHFMAESAAPDFGKSFEVRNITFRNVPEDCIGMEGVQEGSTLTASVERCWIHNCEFYVPHISNPAESDKAEGDGACDFKRGQYFTNSYCYYEGYHKTNLVGASDSNLQFFLTYHHNYWKDCESRGPLTRQANVHMYNNVFDGQTSYCMNTRASAYIFSEYNVFKDSKNPMRVDAGAIKSFNDVFDNVKGEQGGTVVTDKSAKVSSGNKYENFDTNSSICYIPSGDYKLDTASSANLFSSLKGIFEKEGGTMDDMTISVSDLIKEGGSSSTTATTKATTSGTTTASTTVSTTVTTVSGNYLAGDANEDGTVTMADAVAILQYLANSVKYPLTAQGIKNADVSGNGDGISGLDALAIQRYDAHSLTALPE